jgi:UTP--glucose-1-phosphate uridylyltransferase
MPAQTAHAVRRAPDRRPARRIRKALVPVDALADLPPTPPFSRRQAATVENLLLHYAIEETLQAGIRQFVLVASRDWARRASAAAARRQLSLGDAEFQLCQAEPGGLAASIRSARRVLGDEPFLVVTPEQLVDAAVPAAAQIVDAYERFGHSVLGVVPSASSAAGVHLAESALARRLYDVSPVPSSRSPIPLALAGRYALSPEIHRRCEPTADGSDRDTAFLAAVHALAAVEPVYRHELEGERFDCRSTIGYLAAIAHLAMRHRTLSKLVAPLFRRGALRPNVPAVPA